jgi:drug/metabolite transporter (DMT)-like permease
MLGLLLGFLGTGLLIAPGDFGGGAVNLAGALSLLLASVSWSAATVLSPRMPLPESLSMTSSLEMLSGGTVLGLVALASGEWHTFTLAAVSRPSLWALAYLILFGSLLAFSAFAWLLRVSTPERVSTCAYVNPAVAVGLGWLLAGETLNPRSLVAGMLILAAVVLIVSKKRAVRGER